MLKISRAALIAAALTAGSVATHSFAQELSLDTPSDMTSSEPGDSVTIAPGEPNPNTPPPAMSYNFAFDIPSIVAVGSSMDETALREALTGKYAEHASDLATLTATSITIPEIRLTTTTSTTSGTMTQTASYKNIVLSNIANGIAAELSTGDYTTSMSATGEMQQTGMAEMSSTFGASSAKNVNLGAIAAFLTGGASGGMQTIYTDYVASAGTLTTSVFNCEIGEARSDLFEARPLKYSFKDVASAMERMTAAGANPAPSDIATYARFFADAVQAFHTSSMSVSDINCSNASPDAPFSVKLAKAEIGEWNPGFYPSISLEGLVVKSDGNDGGELASFTFKGMDLANPIAMIEGAADTDFNPAWFAANARKFIPEWDGFAFSGLKLDVPNPQASNARILAGIGEFDLTLGHYTNGIPADISSFARNVKYTIPTTTTDPQQQMMLALGITELDLGYNIDLNWDEASKTVRIDDVSVNGANLGSIALASTIGNALPQLFDTDPQIEQRAAMSLTLKDLNLNLVDAGLGDILIAVMAGQQGGDPAQMRTALAGQAGGSVLQIFGATPEAQGLSNAVTAFVGGTAKSLAISLVSKDPAGLPLPLLMQGSQDPNVLINQITVTGQAQ